MRIGIVCPYSFSRPGGVQAHVRGLGEYLVGQGHDVDVLAPGERTPGWPRRSQPAFTSAGSTWRVPINGSVAPVKYTPGTAAIARRWLAAGRFDVVHVHEPLAPALASQVLAALARPGSGAGARVGVVATMHASRDDTWPARLAGLALRRRLRRIDVALAVSDPAADLASTYLPARPRVVPNGIWVADLGSTTTGPRASGPGSVDPARGGHPGSGPHVDPHELAGRGAGLVDAVPHQMPSAAGWRGGERPRITFLGRDEPRKGLDVLLAALPALLARVDADVVVAGPGTRDLPPGCRRLVVPDDAAKAALLASTDVLVSPAVAGESFGIVLVEALAAGCQVVASDLPAFTAVLSDAGTTFPAGDPAALADAVVGRLSHPVAAAALASRACQFDWSTVGAEILDAYGAALA